jgi:transcriptional regulator with XRE-family HTH domain
MEKAKRRLILDIYEIGPRIAKRRKEMGLTQQELCDYAKISRVTLSGFENGAKTGLSLAKLGVILDRLGLEVDIKTRSSLPTLDELLDVHH